MSGDPKLKPCPFCGGTDIRHHATLTYEIGRRCKCMSCHAEGPPARWDLKGDNARDTERLRTNAAFEAWNRRAIPEGYVLVPATEVEYLRAELASARAALRAPDYVLWDENVIDWSARDDILDSADLHTVTPVKTYINGPTMYGVCQEDASGRPAHQWFEFEQDALAHSEQQRAMLSAVPQDQGGDRG